MRQKELASKIRVERQPVIEVRLSKRITIATATLKMNSSIPIESIDDNTGVW